MRALFTSLPAMGHVNSVLPLATAILDAGHEVAMCCSPAFAGTLRDLGIPHFPGGATTLDELLPPGNKVFGPERTRFMRQAVFAGSAPERLIPDLARAIDAWKPDVLVRESAEFAACVLAEKLDLVHAAVATGAESARDDHRLAFAEPLSALRLRHGLPPDRDAAMMNRYLTFSLMPRAWDGAAALPGTLHHVRYVHPVRPGEKLPTWLDGPRERPLVLAALGTLMYGVPGLMEAIIHGLAELPVDVLAAIGQDQDPARFGAVPSNVRLERYVPQIIVLSRAALFVTHGGFNSTKEALSQGVPLVVVPIGGDQPYTAERAEALGLGRAVSAGERDPQTIGARAREVLDGPAYRQSAARFAVQIKALPPLSEAVTLLERLVRDRTPVLATAGIAAPAATRGATG